MKVRTAIRTDMLAADAQSRKIDTLSDPLSKIDSLIDFAALAAEVDRFTPRTLSPHGGHPTETMVRILLLKRSYNLSDEKKQYQLLDYMNYQRFCGLSQASNISDRTKIWTIQNIIGEAGAYALFFGMKTQLLAKAFIDRGGQIIDATLMHAPKPHLSKEE